MNNQYHLELVSNDIYTQQVSDHLSKSSVIVSLLPENSGEITDETIFNNDWINDDITGDNFSIELLIRSFITL